MTSQALAIKPPSSSPGYQREISRRATGRGVDRRPAGQVTTHWKLSPTGRLVASWTQALREEGTHLS